jgi:uncharacterized protein YeaO (DUF488 family)
MAARDQKTDLACDEWCKTLTPSNELRKAFHSEAIDFDAFSQAYREELAQHQDEGLRLAERAKNRPSRCCMALRIRSRITRWC